MCLAAAAGCSQSGESQTEKQNTNEGGWAPQKNIEWVVTVSYTHLNVQLRIPSVQRISESEFNLYFYGQYIYCLLYTSQLDDKHFVYRNINFVSSWQLFYSAAKIFLVNI